MAGRSRFASLALPPVTWQSVVWPSGSKLRITVLLFTAVGLLWSLDGYGRDRSKRRNEVSSDGQNKAIRYIKEDYLVKENRK